MQAAVHDGMQWLCVGSVGDALKESIAEQYGVIRKLLCIRILHRKEEHRCYMM